MSPHLCPDVAQASRLQCRQARCLRHDRFRLVVPILAAAALALLASACAPTLRDRRVLIMNFENGVSGAENGAFSVALAEMFTASLANSPRVSLLDRQDLGGLLSRTTGERALRWQEIGKRAGADYMIIGSIAKLDQNYLINARLLSVRNGEIVKGSSISRYARREEDIYPAVQAICYALGFQLKYLAELYDRQALGTAAPAAQPVAASPAPTPVPFSGVSRMQ